MNTDNNNTPQPQMVGLSNGQQALNLMPQMTGTAALVDLNTIKRLASLLPTASVNKLIGKVVDDMQVLMASDHNQDTKMNMFMDIMESEVAFHQTVNIIKTVTIPAPPLALAVVS